MAADGTLIVMVIARQLEASHRLALTAPVQRRPRRPAATAEARAEVAAAARVAVRECVWTLAARRQPTRPGGSPARYAQHSLQRLPSAHRLSSSVGTFALQLILAAATGLALTLPWTLFSGQPYPCADAIGCDAESDAAAAAGDFAAVPDGASPFLSRLVLPVSSPSTATHAHLPLWCRLATCRSWFMPWLTR